MEIRLTAETGFPWPVDVAGLSPGFSAGWSIDRLASTPIVSGHRAVPAGELFRIQDGSGEGRRILLQGDWSRVVNIAAGLESGTVRVESAVGAGAGRGMAGGEIHVGGNAGDHLGQGMRGGLIRVQGDAGDEVAGPFPGHASGMNGGGIWIAGNCGSHAGFRLRRGTLFVQGNCGRLAGYEMRGGNLMIGGRVGEGFGESARRGTLVFGQRPAVTEGSFRRAGVFRPSFLPMLFRDLLDRWRMPALPLPELLELWSGDWLYGGKAELWIPEAM